MSFPAVVLDVDGTLVDSNYQHALTWHRAFAQHGCAVPAWRAHRAIGMGGDQLVPRLAGDDWDAEHGDAVRATEAALFGELIDRVAPLPGARAFLELLEVRGHAVVLASSAKAHELELYVDLLGARDLAQAWTTSADVERTKPAPDVVHTGLERLGGPRDAVMVGDSVYDIEAAGRAGIPAVALLSGGFGAGELEGAGASHVTEDLPALIADIDRTPLGGRARSRRG
jgi:HAD superfamily hydrolase (TIGR01509 family)